MISRRNLIKVFSGIAAGLFVKPLAAKADSKLADNVVHDLGNVVYHCGSSRMLLDTDEELIDSVSEEVGRYIRVAALNLENKSNKNVCVSMLFDGKQKITFYLSKNGGGVDIKLNIPLGKAKKLSFQVTTSGWTASEVNGVHVYVAHQLYEECK